MKAAKLTISLLAALTAYAALLSAAETSAAKTLVRYAVGDTGPAGGVIFFDKGNISAGWRYLEAAPEDQSKGAKWRSADYTYVSGTAAAIGTGRLNTKKIIAAQGDGVYAAKLCADYRGGGKSDWFLPSKNELLRMRSVLAKLKKCALTGEFYWSSTQMDGSIAWLQSSASDRQDADDKDFSASVRAIRAF
jgi:hypothetical protein